MKNDKNTKTKFYHKNRKKRYSKVVYLIWLELKRVFFRRKFAAEFDITYRCNLRCKHCYNIQLSNDRSNEYPLEIWKKRFDEMFESGIRFVQIMGGEPTLRLDIIEYAMDTFPFVFVSTNGLIKIPEDWDINIILSIDGMKENNDSIRGKGVFEAAIKNYRGDGRVMVNMVLTSENYKDLEDVVLLANRCGFRGVLCNIFSTSKDDVDNAITDDKRKKLTDELRKVREKHPDTLLMNEKMIQWFQEADHRDSCHWREQIYHYDVDWNPRVCYSNIPDCGNCGCMAGAMQSPFKMLKHSSDMVKLII